MSAERQSKRVVLTIKNKLNKDLDCLTYACLATEYGIGRQRAHPRRPRDTCLCAREVTSVIRKFQSYEQGWVPKCSDNWALYCTVFSEISTEALSVSQQLNLRHLFSQVLIWKMKKKRTNKEKQNWHKDLRG